ncbi:uncharacterized protein B0P05DRAFT_543260 [Gilbertella persicaria]|uniref:uncharacterized protein n=1 Tax=Gilbertella persicaria TaxID=101096 RepID=UPI00221F9E5E|nr:uncharacterized protein B0P05DRAFT_543260 [Gilbertella persicaria]KAI8077898.1 hypothetical protein B0P05DRAFT_543260 [Gilbertella persicaria]
MEENGSRDYSEVQVLYASQTSIIRPRLVFCFQKLVHPVNRTEKAIRTVKGAFYCLNKDYVSVKNKKATMSRDRLSALWRLILLVSLCCSVERSRHFLINSVNTTLKMISNNS